MGWDRELTAGVVCELVVSLRPDVITPTGGGAVVRGREGGFTCSLVSALALPTNTDVLTLAGGGADTEGDTVRLVLGFVRERVLVGGTGRDMVFEVVREGLLMRAVRLGPMLTGGVGVATGGVGTALSSPSKAAMLRCCTITWTSPAVI